MKKVFVLTVVASVLASVRTAIAVPVVPNFTQGAMTSTTETTSTVTETINSMNYDTGYQYVITGTNVQMDGASISPTSNLTTENTIEGVTSTWTGLDLNQKPNFTLADPTGLGAFQYTESYSGPGLSNVTTINRQITVESTQVTQSIFQR